MILTFHVIASLDAFQGEAISRTVGKIASSQKRAHRSDVVLCWGCDG